MTTASQQPQARPHKGKGKGPTGGTGKKRKVFSEDQGSSYLLSLASNVASSEETKSKERVDKNKERAKWLKDKNRERNRTQLAKVCLRVCVE